MRRPDWPERLHEYVEARRDAPHVWGSNDCAMFAAGAVEAMTGVDPFARWRGTYTDKDTAMCLLSAEGGFEALCLRTFGEPVAVLQARRGDLLLGRLNTEDGLAVCLGTIACAPGARHIAHDKTEPGLAFLPFERFRLAYRVD
jgi:hypothetical protein